jgi:hypothetical protein
MSRTTKDFDNQKNTGKMAELLKNNDNSNMGCAVSRGETPTTFA